MIKLRWWTQSERFVRTLLIVSTQPLGKPSLLRGGRGGRGTGGVGFEFAMPLLMRRVVARTGATAEGGPDAQTHPPGAQLRKPSRTGTGPRPSLIGVNALWQTKPSKQPQKHVLNRDQLVSVQYLDGQPKAAVSIAHR